MKICPNCQQEMDDSFTTCENCGADLVDMVGEEERSANTGIHGKTGPP